MSTEIPLLALTVEQTRTSIGLSRTRIYELIKTGELRTLKIGSRRLVRRAEIERFLAEHESAGAAPVEVGAN